MLDYTIITKHQVYTDDNVDERIKEQNDKLHILGFNFYEDYLCHFFESGFYDETTTPMGIDSAIQRLAIKDGIDLVQFSNGNYGFVAYYNGEENGFEMIG